MNEIEKAIADIKAGYHTDFTVRMSLEALREKAVRDNPKKKVKCLNCGYSFILEGADYDKLGWHTTCPQCGGSFDIDL